MPLIKLNLEYNPLNLNTKNFNKKLTTESIIYILNNVNAQSSKIKNN